MRTDHGAAHHAVGKRGRCPGRARRLVGALLLGSVLVPLVARAGERGFLRVGTSGDYAPFSVEMGGRGDVEGFDVAVARAYAADRDLGIEFVRFRWPDLLRALGERRFDVVMSGVTVRPERSAVGRFTVPVVESGAVVLVWQPERWGTLADLDRAAARIGVNAGGYLEEVARTRFPHATVVAMPENLEVREALEKRRVDAAVSDTLEAPGWLRNHGGWKMLGPFTRDRKAYLVHPDRPALARDLDAWLLAREQDGGLDRLRRAHLGTSAGAVATPLAALLAAVDERLSLMPCVAVAKQATDLPVAIPSRELVVLERAVAGVHVAAKEEGVVAPPDAALRDLLRAQMDAAREVQQRALADARGHPPASVLDLETVLRPALDRIDDRVVRLLVVLPRGLGLTAVRAATHEAIRTPLVSEEARGAIAAAIARCSAPAGE